MKIIGNMGPHTYMVEITREELQHLDKDRSIQIGVEFPIMPAVKTLDTLRSLDRLRLTYMSEHIDKLKSTFEDIQDSYNALMLFDRLKSVDKPFQDTL